MQKPPAKHSGIAGDRKNDSSSQFPRWVRVLAVVYMLSMGIGPVGFVLMNSIAGLLWTIRREVDGWVLGLGIRGLACPVLCAAFRWWFRHMGQRRWPDGRPTAAPEPGGN